jgi:hypothetical protein
LSRSTKLSPASSTTRLERREQLQQQHIQAQLLRAQELQGQQLLQSGEILTSVQTSLESSDSLAATDGQAVFLSTDDNSYNVTQADLN